MLELKFISHLNSIPLTLELVVIIIKTSVRNIEFDINR